MTRSDVHTYPIVGIFRVPDVTYTLDSSGRFVIWLPDHGDPSFLNTHTGLLRSHISVWNPGLPRRALYIPRNPK